MQAQSIAAETYGYYYESQGTLYGFFCRKGLNFIPQSKNQVYAGVKGEDDTVNKRRFTTEPLSLSGGSHPDPIPRGTLGAN